jgi:hypothetical protein
MTAVKDPFAYVLYIDRGTEEHLVSLYQRLDEAEEALRAFARTIVVGPRDNEIAEVLAEDGVHARIYACTLQRRGQSSTEVQPFAAE